MNTRRPVTTLAMSPHLPSHLFTDAQRAELLAMATVSFDEVLADFGTAEARARLAETEVLVTGWGTPVLDASLLDVASRLRAVIHTGGTVKGLISAEWWDRGLAVSSAAQANALPVAEYTLAMILLANKGVHRSERLYRKRRAYIDRELEFPRDGNYGRTVGVIAASRIGRRVIELLRPFDLDVVVSDPYLSPAEAALLGVRLVDLDELLAVADVVSVHAPSLPETRHLIDRRGLARIRDGVTLINTARGALVDQDALLDELRIGRINAVLDVTEPDVLPADSDLYELPNVVLTPHMAGAAGVELRRLAESALQELARYIRGEQLVHAVDPALFDRAA